MYMKNISWGLMMFFWVLLCNAQNQQFEINWEGSKVFSSGISNIELPYFDAKHYNYSEENVLHLQHNGMLDLKLTQKMSPYYP